MAGYSGTPLVQKLGIKPGHAIAVLHSPEGFAQTLGDLPPGVALASALGRRKYDVILFFTDQLARLRKRFAQLVAHLQPAGGLWIAWPKKASGVPTDLTEDVIRALAVEVGLVDNKVCAIDTTWSGLRLVIRLANRR